MNDLISRDALVDELKQSGMIVDNDYGNAMLDFINNQSTAYDADKVIEQIRKAKDEYGMVDYINDKPVIAKEQAIEIIKKGGIE